MTPRADRSESAGRAVSVKVLARKRQGVLRLIKLLQILAGLIWLGMFITLFRKFGGEMCEVFLFGSSLVATLIASVWQRRTRA